MGYVDRIKHSNSDISLKVCISESEIEEIYNKILRTINFSSYRSKFIELDLSLEEELIRVAKSNQIL